MKWVNISKMLKNMQVLHKYLLWISQYDDIHNSHEESKKLNSLISRTNNKGAQQLLKATST